MKYYDEFKISIYNEANIVALCPTCHRKIHFGQPKYKECSKDEEEN
jgi:predicted HNH restriction endonuclease